MRYRFALYLEQDFDSFFTPQTRVRKPQIQGLFQTVFGDFSKRISRLFKGFSRLIFPSFPKMIFLLGVFINPTAPSKMH